MIEADLPSLIAYHGTAAGADPHMSTAMTSPHKMKKRFAETGYSTHDSETGRVIGDVMHFNNRPYGSVRDIDWVIYDEK